MKRFVTALLLLVMMFSPALALSDSEYLRMRKSNADFARADKRLNQVWAGLKKSLPKKIFSQLDKLQREWVKSGRDDEAESLMNDGYSRMEAYTLATNDRADSLPKIADELRESHAQNTTRTPIRRQQSRNEESETESPRRNQIRRSQDDDSESEPEPQESAILRPSDIEGEYQNDSGFVSVRITDINSDEAEVTFSRFKDGVHWTAKGWLDGNALELSDQNYSECQATLTFSRRSVKVETSDTEDWNEAISPDFVLKGTYNKLAN